MPIYESLWISDEATPDYVYRLLLNKLLFLPRDILRGKGANNMNPLEWRLKTGIAGKSAEGL